jgi:hypothetical protein
MRRSVSGMRGLTMHATDGDRGSVDEFVCDDAQWTIRSLVAHTGGWLTGRLVCVAPIACRLVDGDRETFDVALTRQQVEGYSRYYGYPYDWDELGMWAPACTHGWPTCPLSTPCMGRQRLRNSPRATPTCTAPVR